jgi:hypothetical protein
MGRINIGGDQWTFNQNKTHDVAFRFERPDLSRPRL